MNSWKIPILHDDVNKWNHFPCYWSLVPGIHRPPVNSLTKASDAEFDIFFDMRLNKLLSKQSWGMWFETPLRPIWRHCNDSGLLHWLWGIMRLPWYRWIIRVTWLCIQQLQHTSTHQILLRWSPPDRSTSSWWLPMPWCHIGARPPATTMKTRLWVGGNVSYYATYISCDCHQTMIERAESLVIRGLVINPFLLICKYLTPTRPIQISKYIPTLHKITLVSDIGRLSYFGDWPEHVQGKFSRRGNCGAVQIHSVWVNVSTVVM